MYIPIKMPHQLTSLHHQYRRHTVTGKGTASPLTSWQQASLSAPSTYVHPPTDLTTPPNMSSTSCRYTSRPTAAAAARAACHEDQQTANLSAARAASPLLSLATAATTPTGDCSLPCSANCSEQRVHLCPACVLCCLQCCTQLPSQCCCQWGRHCIADLPVPVVHVAAELEVVGEALQASTAAAAALHTQNQHHVCLSTLPSNFRLQPSWFRVIERCSCVM